MPTSEEYWAQRRKQLLAQMEKDEAKLNKKLASLYASEEAKLSREIASYYQRFGEDNVIQYRKLLAALSEEDRTLLMEKMDKFAQKYPQWAHLMPVRETIYQLNELEGLQMSMLMQQLEIGAIEQQQVEEHLSKQALRSANLAAAELGFGAAFYAVNSDVIKATVGKAWSQGKNYSERIWDNREALARYLNDDFGKLIARGVPYDKCVKDLTERFDAVSKRDAHRLIFTEGSFVFAEANASVLAEQFEEYYVVTAGDGRVCGICRDIAAQTRKEPVRYEEREAGLNFPPLHPWCRCDTVPAVDWDAWLDKKAGGNTASEASYYEAATTEQAQQYASKFVGDGYSPKFKNTVSYGGISVENANEINRALDDLFASGNMPKLNGIKAISANSAQGKKVFSSSDAIMAYNPVEHGIFLNKDVLKSTAAIADYNAKAKEAWDYVIEHMDRLTGAKLQTAKLYKEAGRSLVGDGSVYDYVVHEVGHHVEWSVLDAAMHNAMAASKKKYAPHISGYANSSTSEYIAESYAAYVKGESDIIDPDFVDYLKAKGIERNAVAKTAGDQVNLLARHEWRDELRELELDLPFAEKQRVASAVNTNFARFEGKDICHIYLQMDDDAYMYTFLVDEFDEYVIIGKEVIE